MPRTKGATSLETVKLSELNDLLGPTDEVVIGRVWLSKLRKQLAADAKKLREQEAMFGKGKAETVNAATEDEGANFFKVT